MQVLARCPCKFSEARARIGCHILKFHCSKCQRNCETWFKAPDDDRLLSHFPSPRFNLSRFRFVLERVLMHASKDRFKPYPLRMAMLTTIYGFGLYKWWIYVSS